MLFQEKCMEGVEIGFVFGEFKRTLLMNTEILLYNKHSGAFRAISGFLKVVWKKGKLTTSTNQQTWPSEVLYQNIYQPKRMEFALWWAKFKKPQDQFTESSFTLDLFNENGMCVCENMYIRAIMSLQIYPVSYGYDMRYIKTPVSLSFFKHFPFWIWIPL